MPVADVIAVLKQAKDPLLATHRHADRDSLGSAVGLAGALDVDATICTPDGIAKPAQPLVTDGETIEDPDVTTHDVVVVLDAPSTDRIAPVDPGKTDLVVVDHHSPDDLESIATAAYVDETAQSTAELVYEIVRAAEWELTEAVAYPLVVGILDDTGFLQAARPKQIRYVCELLPYIEGRAADIAALFDPEPQPGERMAQLKATARASFYQAEDVAIGITHVGGFETAAAHALRGAGVACALVWSEQSDHVRVVGRCSEAFASEFSLGSELLPVLGAAYGGSGGGHDAAAGARLNLDPSQTDVTACIRNVLERELGVEFATLGD